MSKSSTLNCSGTIRNQLTNYYALTLKAFTSVFMFFALLFSTTASAQSLPTCTKGNRTFLPHCTSQDLTVVSASLKADQCYCTNGDEITASIVMKLNNKTGSERTSFAFFAILEQTNPTTGVVTKSYITGCTGPIEPGSSPTAEFPDPDSGDPKYKFKCGNTLKLTQVYLAWTDASDGEARQCPLDFCSIAPKCGTPADIIITPLLTASATFDKACQGVSDGSITVKAVGGKAPYTYKLIGPDPSTTSQTNTTGVFNNLAAGKYTCEVTDSDNPACTFTFKPELLDEPCCVKPPKPTLCEIQAGLCGNGKVTLRIINAVKGDTYYLVQGSTTTKLVAAGTTLDFTDLVAGSKFDKIYGENTVGTATCTGDAATCTDLKTTCSSSVNQAVNTREAEVQAVKPMDIDARITSDKTKVLAAPNPFTNRVRFTLQSDISGIGSLEIFNTMGQKLATVYQGYVEAGKVLNKEYSVQRATRANLIYVFRVGDQKTTGKLLNW